MELTPDQLHHRLDAVAGGAGGAAGPDRARIERRAGELRRRRRAATAGALATVTILAIGVALWPRDSDVSVLADGPTTTTTAPSSDLDAQVVVRRDTPHGELVVTVGPATQPWHFDPNGPTDRWREPASCYPPRLSIDLGRRRMAVGVASTDAPILLPLVLRNVDDEEVAVAVVVVFGADDEARYRLTSAAGGDEAVASDGIAVLVRPGEFRPGDVNAAPWSDFTIEEVAADGTSGSLAVDLAVAENAFYAGDVNGCPNHTGVTPRPTVPTPPDVGDAAAAAARALDPSTSRADALALLGDDPATEQQLAALHARLAQQAAGVGVTALRVAPDEQRSPVFHSPTDGWVSLSLRTDGGPTWVSAWARVERDGTAWRVDPRTVCGAFAGFVLGDAPTSCPE